MKKKLIIGGFGLNVVAETLTELFQRFGPIAGARVARDEDTGSSLGFGFVTFQEVADADDAIAKMNGQVLDGRTLRVHEARVRRAGAGTPPQGEATAKQP